MKKIATHSIGRPTLRRHSSASTSMPTTAMMVYMGLVRISFNRVFSMTWALRA